MKIGQSTVYFAITLSTYPYKSIEEVPYWSLYSRPGDYIQEKLGYQWRCEQPLTLAEIKKYLESYPYKRLLDAYPRKSIDRRTKYKVSVGDYINIYDKWTGVIYATFVKQNGKICKVYLSNDAQETLEYYRRMAKKAAEKYEREQKSKTFASTIEPESPR